MLRSAAPKKTVLIVDDQPEIRLLVRLALKEIFLLEEAGNAQAAFDHLSSNPVDAVVLDVMMPGQINGKELCARIKADPRLAHIHVVLVSARGQQVDREEGLQAGADAYFVKPFSPLALRNHLCGAMLSQNTNANE